jgi:hypothetical protein
MGQGMVMADTNNSDVGTIGVQGKATAGGGYMVQEESIKGRSTVTKEALDKQTATGNAVDKLKYTPGLNISSEDNTGLSGFRFTMRGPESRSGSRVRKTPGGTSSRRSSGSVRCAPCVFSVRPRFSFRYPVIELGATR